MSVRMDQVWSSPAMIQRSGWSSTILRSITSTAQWLPGASLSSFAFEGSRVGPEAPRAAASGIYRFSTFWKSERGQVGNVRGSLSRSLRYFRVPSAGCLTRA